MIDDDRLLSEMIFNFAKNTMRALKTKMKVKNDDDVFSEMIFNFAKSGSKYTMPILGKVTLETQLKMLRERDYSGWCILHWAIYHNQDQLAKALLDRYLGLKINPDADELRTEPGFIHGNETALHIALKYANSRSSTKREDLILYLLDKGADPKLTDLNNMNALDWAVYQNLVGVITALIIRFDDNLFLKQNNKGDTALHKAVEYQYRSCIEALTLYKNGILLEIKNKAQQTPLDLMRNSNSREMNELCQRILAWRATLQQRKEFIDNKLSQIQGNDSHRPQNINYICTDPISLQPITNPFVDEHGCTYEESTIKDWLKDHDTCPVWNKKLTSKNLVPNYTLKQILDQLNSPVSSAGQKQEAVQKRKEGTDTPVQESKKSRLKR